MYLFGLLGLITGLMLGICLTKINTQKKYQEKTFQNNLLGKKIKILHERQQELENYFHQNTTLLNVIINHCQELYQNMTMQHTNILHIKQNKKNNEKHLSQNVNYYNHLTQNDNSITKKQLLTKEPRDYPEDNNY